MWKLLTYKHTTNGDIRSIVSLKGRCVAVNEHKTILDVLESTIEFNEQTHPEYFL